MRPHSSPGYRPPAPEAIYKHVDEHRPGEYRFTAERTKIAAGPLAIAF